MGSTRYMAQRLKNGDAIPRQILDVILFRRLPLTPDEFGPETSAIGSVLKLSFQPYQVRPNPTPYETWASVLVRAVLESETETKSNPIGPPTWVGRPRWPPKEVAKVEDVLGHLLTPLHMFGVCSNLVQGPMCE